MYEIEEERNYDSIEDYIERTRKTSKELSPYTINYFFKKLLNSRKTKKEIYDKAILKRNFSCKDSNFGVFVNSSHLQKIYDTNRERDRVRKDSSVLKMCLDESCSSKYVAKVIPYFKHTLEDENGVWRRMFIEEEEIDSPNVEISIIKLLTKCVLDKNKSPNIVRYYADYSCSIKDILIKEHTIFKKFVEEGKIKPKVNILVAEFIDGKAIAEFVRNDLDNTRKGEEQVRSIIFQVLYTLVLLQRMFKFVHYDLHMGNVIIDYNQPKSGFWSYNLELPTSREEVGISKIINRKAQGKEYKQEKEKVQFYVPCNGVSAKIWDFDFATTFKKYKGEERIRNYKVEFGRFEDTGVHNYFRSKFDIFFFLINLFIELESSKLDFPDTYMFIRKVLTDGLLDYEDEDFVKKNRLLVDNVDVLDPEDALNLSYFDKYRYNKRPNEFLIHKPEYRE